MGYVIGISVCKLYNSNVNYVLYLYLLKFDKLRNYEKNFWKEVVVFVVFLVK